MFTSLSDVELYEEMCSSASEPSSPAPEEKETVFEHDRRAVELWLQLLNLPNGPHKPVPHLFEDRLCTVVFTGIERVCELFRRSEGHMQTKFSYTGKMVGMPHFKLKKHSKTKLESYVKRCIHTKKKREKMKFHWNDQAPEKKWEEIIEIPPTKSNIQKDWDAFRINMKFFHHLLVFPWFDELQQPLCVFLFMGNVDYTLSVMQRQAEASRYCDMDGFKIKVCAYSDITTFRCKGTIFEKKSIRSTLVVFPVHMLARFSHFPTKEYNICAFERNPQEKKNVAS